MPYNYLQCGTSVHLETNPFITGEQKQDCQPFVAEEALVPVMAWQNSAAMVGNGGGPAGGGEGSNGGQPLGTEYTLQGMYNLGLNV